MVETVSTRRIRPSPPVTRGRQNLENWRAMKWLAAEIKERRLSLREVARRMGYPNATRIREYLDQRIVPGPAVLGNLAMAIGVSPIEALWLAGRREAIFDYLHALYQLGWAWMRTDRLHLDQTGGAVFIGHHTASARGDQIHREVDLSAVPDELRHRYHQADVYNYGGLFRHVALPKPMACAILLAIGLFPRRGERVHQQGRTFIQELGFIAVRMLPAAERVTVPHEVAGMRRPLKSAEEILPFRFYPRAMRLAVVGEYVHAWADFVCKNYADYARIALYECGAFVGEPQEFENIWEWQRTAFPMASDFDTKA
jgi:transcriptional regulator with XRE-family HTH domain